MPFQRLDEILLPPPIASFVTVVFVLGLLRSAQMIARQRWRHDATPVDEAAVFFTLAATVATVVHLCACLHAPLTLILRLSGLPFVLLGIVVVVQWARRPRAVVEALRPNSSSRWVQAAVWVGYATMLLLSLASLGPPTDADSLDYHLGVPLDWLRHGYAYPRPDWLHSRLVGIGENLVLIGLGLGTDNLSAGLQVASLIVATRALGAISKSDHTDAIAVIFFVAAPTMLFLAPNQKPQLMPSLAMATAFMLIRLPKEDRRPRHVWLAMACVTFGAGCKYSFYLNAAILLVAGMTVFPPLTTLLAFTLCYLFFVFPQQLRSFAFYGDPLSPLLERFLANPDETVIRFANYLRDTSGTRTVDRFLEFSVELFLPPSRGGVSLTLGLGFLGFALGWFSSASRRAMLSPTIAFVISLCFMPLSARFFLDIYLWTGVVLVTTAPGFLRRTFFALLSIQTLAMFAGAGYAAWTLFPGAWSAQRRHAVMMQCSEGYDSADWADRTLPSDAVVLYRSRSAALAPRDGVLLIDYHHFTLTNPHTSIGQYILLRLKGEKRPVFVMMTSEDRSAVETLVGPLGPPIGKAFQSHVSTRNPFNRRPGEIYLLHEVKRPLTYTHH